jgi:hypothetical protein
MFGFKLTFRKQALSPSSDSMSTLVIETLVFKRTLTRLIARETVTSYSTFLQQPSIYGGRLFRPEPEDAPCRGDRGPTLHSVSRLYCSTHLYFSLQIMVSCKAVQCSGVGLPAGESFYSTSDTAVKHATWSARPAY